MEPPVSVPVAAKAALAATAAADPPDDPPGVLFSSKFHGLITSPLAAVSLLEPIANSSHESFPKLIAPSFQRL